jgi:hypothetical protein
MLIMVCILFYSILQHTDTSNTQSHKVIKYFSVENVENISLLERNYNKFVYKYITMKKSQ